LLLDFGHGFSPLEGENYPANASLEALIVSFL
jgi:hypothetical protein